MKKLMLLCLVLFVESLYANVRLNSLFQNNMVLQRGKPIAIFGKATSEKTVEVTFKNKTYVAKVENGYWKLYLDKAKAGGPFELTIKGNNKITLSNVLVGEVWLCSGQSNMAMQMKGNFGQPINGSNTAILKSKNSNLRLFTVKRNLSNEPIDIFEGDWKISNPESVKSYSATAYYFGKQLQETLGVPVGLICSAWGGTPTEAWTPNEIIKTQFKILVDGIKTRNHLKKIHQYYITV